MYVCMNKLIAKQSWLILLFLIICASVKEHLGGWVSQHVEWTEINALSQEFLSYKKKCPRIKIFRKFLSYGIIFFALG